MAWGASRRHSFMQAGRDVAQGQVDAKESRLGSHAGGQSGCAKACCVQEQPARQASVQGKPGDALGRARSVQGDHIRYGGQRYVKIPRSERCSEAVGPFSGLISAQKQQNKASTCAMRPWGCIKSRSLCVGRSSEGGRPSCCENSTERAPNGRSISSLQLPLAFSHSI